MSSYVISNFLSLHVSLVFCRRGMAHLLPSSESKWMRQCYLSLLRTCKGQSWDVLFMLEGRVLLLFPPSSSFVMFPLCTIVVADAKLWDKDGRGKLKDNVWRLPQVQQWFMTQTMKFFLQCILLKQLIFCLFILLFLYFQLPNCWSEHVWTPYTLLPSDTISKAIRYASRTVRGNTYSNTVSNRTRTALWPGPDTFPKTNGPDMISGNYGW